jgi:hypothetical protein
VHPDCFPTPAGFGGLTDFAAEDIDGDGDRDMIIERFHPDYSPGRYFQILRQVAPRQFVDESASRISMDTSLEAVDFFRVQDINGDGFLDIFVDDKFWSPVTCPERRLMGCGYAWTNNGQGVFTPYFGAKSSQWSRQPADRRSRCWLRPAAATPGASLIVTRLRTSAARPGRLSPDLLCLHRYHHITADASLGFGFTSLCRLEAQLRAVQLPASLLTVLHRRSEYC